MKERFTKLQILGKTQYDVTTHCVTHKVLRIASSYYYTTCILLIKLPSIDTKQGSRHALRYALYISAQSQIIALVTCIRILDCYRLHLHWKLQQSNTPIVTSSRNTGH